MFSPVGDPLTLALGQEKDIVVFMDGSGASRAKNITLYPASVAKRLGIAWEALYTGAAAFDVTIYAVSFLGSYTLGSVGGTPISGNSGVVYLNVIPADLFTLEISASRTSGSDSPNYWKFTVIGSDDLNLGVTP